MECGHRRVTFSPQKLAKDDLTKLMLAARQVASEDQHDASRRLRENAAEAAAAAEEWGDDVRPKSLAVCYSLLADFVEQGWALEVGGDGLVVEQPSVSASGDESEKQVKSRIRKSFEAISNRQLTEPSNQEFLRRMETKREFGGREVSVLDVIDDGPKLAAELGALGTSPDVSDLDEIIRPEIVECRGDEKCPHTGYRLQDIWRYFRHTWSLEYKLLPGRTMRFLVRNAARPNHPVIGIVLLSSPTANLLSRDKWIGWTIESLVDGLLAGKHDAKLIGNRLYGSIKTAIKAIRTDDLVPKSALNHPKPEHFFSLDQIVHKATLGRARDLERNDSQKLVDIRGLDKQKITNAQWKELSSTSLYVKKRAEQLIPLLKSLRVMKAFGFQNEPGPALYEALLDREGKSAIQTALNEIKKVHLASEVADLSVCGSVAPYNAMIGGKLVTALMTSDVLRECYRRRYGKQVSEIASQIRGRRVTRSADLKILTTTALYGVGSNQYSSLKLRSAKNAELAHDLDWRKIDSSEGFTVTHISDATVRLMRELSISVYGRRRINSVFGEGSSPRTRQIREGLNIIGINNDALLRQPNKKKVYACELYPGAKEALLGFKSQAAAESVRSNTVEALTHAWARRWLIPRLAKGVVSDQVAKLEQDHVPSQLKRRMLLHSNVRAD